MSLAGALLTVIWVGIAAYVLFGGADFGGGFWDLVAGDAQRGRPQRELIEHSLGPVWETNHVWLIFVIVLMWTGFPSVFAAIASTLYIPLTLVALGVIARGAAFAFRKAATELWQQRLFGGTFALSSAVTPFFLGAVAGAIAGRRVPPGIAAGDPFGSWVNPTSLYAGVLTVGITAYLAGVYLTRDAERAGSRELAQAYRRRALVVGVVLGLLSLGGLFVVRADVPVLFDELTSGAALVLVGLSVLAGVVSLVLLWWRRYVTVRLTAALAVVGLLGGWGLAQYPELLPGVTVEQAAANRTVLLATLVSVAIAAVLLLPSLWWLYTTFQRSERARAS